MRLGTTTRNAACNAIVDLIDGGTGPGRCEIRAGTLPTNVGDASGGTLLGTLTFSPTAFGNSSNGTATANSITSDTNADASDDADFYRVFAGDAADTACLFDGTAGVGSEDMVFDNNSIVAGGTIAISSMTVTVPIS